MSITLVLSNRVNKYFIFLLQLIFFFTPLESYTQILSINEIMSANTDLVADEDGDFPDWIELYNSGEQIINLSGYGLSDDPNVIMKWKFHDIKIPPKQNMLIFTLNLTT